MTCSTFTTCSTCIEDTDSSCVWCNPDQQCIDASNIGSDNSASCAEALTEENQVNCIANSAFRRNDEPVCTLNTCDNYSASDCVSSCAECFKQCADESNGNPCFNALDWFLQTNKDILACRQCKECHEAGVSPCAIYNLVTASIVKVAYT